jgi:hypothetical protein
MSLRRLNALDNRRLDASEESPLASLSAAASIKGFERSKPFAPGKREVKTKEPIRAIDLVKLDSYCPMLDAPLGLCGLYELGYQRIKGDARRVVNALETLMPDERITTIEMQGQLVKNLEILFLFIELPIQLRTAATMTVLLNQNNHVLSYPLLLSNARHSIMLLLSVPRLVK